MINAGFLRRRILDGVIRRRLGSVHAITKACRKTATKTAVKTAVSTIATYEAKKLLTNLTTNGTLPNGTLLHVGDVQEKVKGAVKNITVMVTLPLSCKPPCRWNNQLKQCLRADGSTC